MISVKKLLAGKSTNKVFALSPAAMVIEALELKTQRQTRSDSRPGVAPTQVTASPRLDRGAAV